MSLEQHELIRQAKDGDEKAIIDLLKGIERSIYQTAFYYMGNEHDARDVTQDTLLKIYTKLNMYQEKSKFSTWVQRITTNVCMDKFRKSKKEVSFDIQEIELEGSLNIEKEIENKVIKEEIMKQIALLPEKIKAVMILRYLQEFSYQEISDTLELPLNTVKSHLFRGRAQIQASMKEYKGGVHRD